MNVQYCICMCGCKDISYDVVCDLCESKLCYLSFMKMNKKGFKMFLAKKTNFIR